MVHFAIMPRVFVFASILALQVFQPIHGQNHAAKPIKPQTYLAALADVLPSGKIQQEAIPHNESQKEEQSVRVTSVPPKDGFDKTYIYVNIGLFLVGIGGVFAAFLTFASVKTSSERQLRAYVMPDAMNLVDGANLDPVQDHRINVPGFEMSIKNTGQTPAYKVNSWVNITVIPLTEEEHSLHIPANWNRGESMVLGKDGSFTHARWLTRTITKEEMMDITEGRRAIFVYGRIEYVDAFNKGRFTDFRFFYSSSLYPPHKSGLMHYSTKGNNSN